MASFSGRDHCAVRALVSSLFAELERSRRDDAATRTARRSYARSLGFVQRYAPELSKRCRPHLKATNDSWRVDETYIKVKKQWVSLYRAVDLGGNTRDFFFSPTRDAHAAKQFFLKTLAASHTMEPRVSTSTKTPPPPKRLQNSKQRDASLNTANCDTSNTSTI